MASTTKISKEIILDFINERIEERSKNQFATRGKYYDINQASISVFQSIRTLINQGVFDENN